jgi:hypothetical protein
MKGQRSVPAIAASMLLALGGCADLPLVPDSDGAEQRGPDVTTNVPLARPGAEAAIHDVITRVLPVLERGGPTAALERALLQILDRLEARDAAGFQYALGEVGLVLEGYEQGAAAEFAPDVDVVRLALGALAGQGSQPGPGTH